MTITFEKLPIDDWEQIGTTHYAVLVDGTKIGEVHHERVETYTTRHGIRQNFSVSWKWLTRNFGLHRRRFDTRQEATTAMVASYRRQQQKADA